MNHGIFCLKVTNKDSISIFLLMKSELTTWWTALYEELLRNPLHCKLSFMVKGEKCVYRRNGSKFPQRSLIQIVKHSFVIFNFLVDDIE